MIVITAPTSQIGRRVLDHVLASGEPVRVVVRDPSRLSPAVLDRVEAVVGSHRDPAVVDEAFRGADAVFWLMPAAFDAPSAVDSYVESSRPGAEAIRAHDVQHVVGVSALGRGTPWAERAGLVTGSLAMDDLFAGVTQYRALANPGFMENTLRSIPEILREGVISSATAPNHALPMVATRDIADAAVTLLLDRSWSGSAEVPLLGPENLSGTDMAAIVAEVLGRAVRYAQVDAADLEKGMLAAGASPAMAAAMADMATAKEHGLDEGVVRAPGNSTPTTFRQWCTEVLRPAVDAAAT